MYNKYIFWAYLAILFELSALGYAQRTKDKMYEKINGFAGCYRRLNGTHQIGCSSNRGGSTGVIHYCETLEDLDFILRNGTAGPYIPVLPTNFFNVETMQKLIASEKVSGLVLHSRTDTMDYYSHEHECPNPQSSLAGTCNKDIPWNKHGTGLLYVDIPIPIFYVDNNEEVLKMRDCFEKFNNFSYESQDTRSLCSLELKAFMFATTNSQTCRRRSNIITNLNPVKFCDPLGDTNIWASLHPLARGPSRNDTRPVKDSKYVVIAARLDTTSLLDIARAGANSPVTGVVTLLTVAKYLKGILQEKDVEQAKTNVLFILFNGETYDYIGSQRLLYDMQKGYFPLKGLKDDNDFLPIIRPENISLFIELSQLGNNKEKVFVHYLKENSKIQGFAEKLKKNSAPILIQSVPKSLPPASLHTFLKNNSEFSGLILSDHFKTYQNPYYNSIYDNATNIQFTYYNTSDDNIDIPLDSIQHFIANVSVMVAKSVYQEITNEEYRGDQAVDVVLINELLYCYLENTNCKVLQATQKGVTIPEVPVSLYVGVDHVSNFATTFTKMALGWFVGDIEGEGNINCTNKPRNYAFRYYNMSKSIYDLNVTLCFKVTVNLTEAISPAFIIPDYDWLSGQYSTWTESTWTDMRMRIFLQPSPAHEKMTIAIGSMTMILSFALVYFMKSRSHILFMPSLPTDAPTEC